MARLGDLTATRAALGDPLRSPVDLEAFGPHGGVVRLLRRLESAEPPGWEVVGQTWGCSPAPMGGEGRQKSATWVWLGG